MSTFSQRFIVRKTKSAKHDYALVYVRLNINGVRTEISVNRNCDPTKWSHSLGRLIGRTEDVREFNSYIHSIELRIYEIHRQLIASNEIISGDSFKSIFSSVERRPRMLLEIFATHNEQFESLVGKEFSINSFKKYRTCYKSLESFIKFKYKKPDLQVSSLRFEFIKDFEFYLKSQKGVQHNSAMGDIKKLKKIVRQCVANNWLEKDPFLGYKVKIRDTSREILLEDELHILTNKVISITRLRWVRDIFLFCCYTGLSYRDVANLRKEDIRDGNDGEKWIWSTRHKTGTPTHIPLLPSALEIIEQYKDDPGCLHRGRLLPVLSNQKMNSYLKELADFCFIGKELTFHCARHTFATTVTLSNGVPIESVSKMLGHRSLRTTQIYAKILDKKVSDDMLILKEKLSKKEHKEDYTLRLLKDIPHCNKD